MATRVIAEEISVHALQPRVVINLFGEPIPEDTFYPTSDPAIVRTNLEYHVRYAPSANRQFKHRPYVLFSDIIIRPNKSQKVRFKDLDELRERAKKELCLDFILRFTNLDENLLNIARTNFGCIIPVAFDIVKYDKMMKEKKGLPQDSKEPMFKDKKMVLAEQERCKAYLAFRGYKEEVEF